MSTHPDPEIRGPYGLFFRNKGLLVTLILFLIMDAMATLLSSGVFRYEILRQNTGSHSALSISERLETFVYYGRATQTGLGAITTILFCLWVNRTNKNGWMLDAPRMRTTPGAAVAAFFIPVSALWKPYGVMKEIRSASYARDDSLGKILTLWWTFTVVSLSFLLIALLLYLDSDKENYLRGCKLELVSTPLAVLRDYFTIALVASITRRQQGRSTFWLK